MARRQMVSPPQEGAEAPEFILPAAQGGQFRLGLRTARGPVIVVFYRGGWSGECVEYFKALAEKEREINVAGATLAGVGVVEPDEAREFARATGFESYILYDYLRETSWNYGLLEKDPERGEISRPAVFLIGSDYTVLRAWPGERPAPDDLLAEVSRVTGLPKEPEEEGEQAEEKPRKRPRKSAKSGGDAGGEAEAGDEEAPKPTPKGDSKEEAGENVPDAPEASKKAEPGAGEATASTAARESDSGGSEPRKPGGEAAETGESTGGAAQKPEGRAKNPSRDSGDEGETGGDIPAPDGER